MIDTVFDAAGVWSMIQIMIWEHTLTLYYLTIDNRAAQLL